MQVRAGGEGGKTVGDCVVLGHSVLSANQSVLLFIACFAAHAALCGTVALHVRTLIGAAAGWACRTGGCAVPWEQHVRPKRRRERRSRQQMLQAEPAA